MNRTYGDTTRSTSPVALDDLDDLTPASPHGELADELGAALVAVSEALGRDLDPSEIEWVLVTTRAGFRAEHWNRAARTADRETFWTLWVEAASVADMSSDMSTDTAGTDAELEPLRD